MRKGKRKKRFTMVRDDQDVPFVREDLPDEEYQLRYAWRRECQLDDDAKRRERARAGAMARARL